MDSSSEAKLPIAGDAMLPTTGNDMFGEHDEFSDIASTVPYEDAPSEAETLPYEDEEAHDNDTLAWWDSVTSITTREPCAYHLEYQNEMDGTIPTTIDDTTPEIEFDPTIVNYLAFADDKLRQAVDNGGRLVACWDQHKTKWIYLVEREARDLTKEEEKKHWKECVQAKRKELKAWVELESLEPAYRREATNPISARWLMKWKLVGGVWIIKARLVIRGFLDKQQNGLDTASFTASRTSQRLVLSVVVQHGWRLFSWDISNAFLRGMSFEEIAKETGQPLREVCMDPPADVYTLLHEYPKFKGCDKLTHFLRLLKGAYGLKDAPKLWKRRLEKALKTLGGVQSMLETCIWLFFQKGDGGKAKLLCILSTHIDDLKGGGEDAFVKWLLEQLEALFGKLKTQHDEFEHCGIMHTQSASDAGGEIVITQDHYVRELKPIPLTKEQRVKDEEGCNDALHSAFLTLLGGVGWTLLTRSDIAVYTTALQRVQHGPCIKHVVKLNRVLRWMRRKPCKIKFVKLKPPLRLIVISDSAFKRTDVSALAVKGHLLGLGESCSETPGGKYHWLEGACKRHRRVNRSTFGCEANGLLDALEPAKVVAMQFAEICDGACTATLLNERLRSGQLSIPIEAVVDAKSVFDAVSAIDPKIPLEESLIAVLMAIREQFAQGLARRLWWCQTEDMLADALTKGAIAREPLLVALATGMWKLQHSVKCATIRKDAVPER